MNCKLFFPLMLCMLLAGCNQATKTVQQIDSNRIEEIASPTEAQNAVELSEDSTATPETDTSAAPSSNGLSSVVNFTVAGAFLTPQSPPAHVKQPTIIIPPSSVPTVARPTIPATLPPTATPNLPTMTATLTEPDADDLYICPDSVVNMREGAGYTHFEKVGQIRPGNSYKVVDEAVGENVFGNTTWYLIEHNDKTAYVTARYAQPCNRIVSTASPTAKPPTQDPTLAYAAACKDKNLLSAARNAREFRHNEVRRATAFCISKHIMVDLKINAIFDPLDEAKREIYALLCGLRVDWSSSGQHRYGMTFDIDGDFIDAYGREMESRAVLARFEPDAVRRINCNSYPGSVNWEYVAESWWVHRALTD